MLKYLTANMDPTSQPFGAVLAATALGWQIFRAPDGAGIVFHTGGTGGYRTFIGFDPTKRIGVVSLTNSAIDASDIALHLIDHGIPLAKPPAARKEAEGDPDTTK